MNMPKGLAKNDDVAATNSLGPSDAIWRWKSWSLVNTGSGNGLLPDGTKP